MTDKHRKTSMRKHNNPESWHRCWQWFGMVIMILVTMAALTHQAFGATWFRFNYPSDAGVSGVFVVTSEATGDSVAGGALTEVDRNARTYWKGSATLSAGSYVVDGTIYEGSDTSGGSYRVDVYPKENYDSLLIVLDSLEALEGWVAPLVQLDSMMMWLGYEIGAVAHTDYATTEDTVWICNGVDTLGKIIYFHTGGAAGDAPDSTKTEGP